MRNAAREMFVAVTVCLLVGAGICQAAEPDSPRLGAVADNPNAGGQESAEASAITLLPTIDRGIHQAMQGRDYDEAVRRIETALDREPGESADYLRYLQGVALTEAERYEQAREAFATLEEDHPDSPWISRARFGRARIHALQRRYDEAGKIYQAEAERLLSRDRKDELAGIYLEFAERFFEGEPAEDPSGEKQPDYEQALAFYQQAIELEPSVQLRQRIEFQIARCHQELGQHAEAIAAYQQLLETYAAAEQERLRRPSLLAEVQFRLATVQLAAGQASEARRTWQDLIRQYADTATPATASDGEASEEAAGDGEVQEDDPTGEDAANSIVDFVARARYRLPHTYGLPQPPDVASLEQAVSLARRFLKQHPMHRLAPQTEIEIARGFAHHNRHVQAVEQLQTLLANDDYDDEQLMAEARRMLGQQWLAQGKYDQAIEAWQEFLQQHPTNPHWPEVQQQIVNAQYAQAAAAREEQRYADARRLWQTFLNQYPLDPRAPTILFQFGSMHYDQALALVRKTEPEDETADEVSATTPQQATDWFEQAIADWRRLVSKYPQHPQASQAAYMIGVTLEDHLHQLPEALEAYKKVQGDRQSQATVRMQRMTKPQLQISTERKFRSDQQPQIRLSTRNLQSVQVKVYRIDMADYFRKMHLATGVESLDIALIDPDQQFEHQVADDAPYKAIDEVIDIPLEEPGVAAVTVSSDKLEATTMVVVSDLDVVVKASREELFLFAQNMRTGQAMPEVSVLMSDGDEVFAEAVTGPDGVLQHRHDRLKTVEDLRVFAIQQGHVAATVNNLKGLEVPVGLTPRGYLYTDRPVYRGGQVVNIRGIVRWVDEDRFTFRPDETFRLDVYDSSGRQLQSGEVRLNAFGSINGHLLLPRFAVQGEYRIHLHRRSRGPADKAGSLSFETRFQVAEYDLDPVEIRIDLDRKVYYRGQTITGTVGLQYYYGTPLAEEQIEYQLGSDSPVRTATTDAQGQVQLELDTQRFRESQPLTLSVRYPHRNVGATATVYLATRGFAIDVQTTRDVYLQGETFETRFHVVDPAGEGVGTDLNVDVIRRSKKSSQQIEETVESHRVTTDPASGEATLTLALPTSGQYMIRATGTDRFGQQISGQHEIQASGDEDETRLRILAERHRYDVGETARVNVHWREDPALALLTFDGASVLGYRLVTLERGDNTIEIPIESAFAPNFYLSVAVMQRNRFHATSSEFRVQQNLQIALQFDGRAEGATDVPAGSQLPVQIRVTDPQGKPVAAELSLALVQANLLDRFAESQAALDAYFNQGKRRTAVRQATSCTFQYQPQTRKISPSLLDESQRVAILEREMRALERLREQAPASAPVDHPFSGAMEYDAMDPFGSQVGQSLALPMPGQGSQQSSGGALQQDKSLSLRMRQLQDRADWMASDMPISAGRYAGAGGEVLGDAAFAKSRAAAVQLNVITDGGRFLALDEQDRTLWDDLAGEPQARVLPTPVYSETAFWDPSVQTDAEGKATVMLTMPSRSTAWRLQTRGITSETLAGQTDLRLITKQDLFAQMRLPLAFTVGDAAEIPVEIHNSLEGDHSIQVQFQASLAGKSVTLSKTIEVQGPGIEKLAFPVEVGEAGDIRFELTVQAGDRAPVTTRSSVRARAAGFPVYRTASGTASQSTLALLAFDQPVPAETMTLQINIGPNLNRTLLQAVLEDVPDGVFFGCGLPVRDPLQRSITDVLAGTALLKMLGDTPHGQIAQARTLDARVVAGVTYLVGIQNQEGGWSWAANAQHGSSDAILSARVMWALSAARSAGLAVPETAFEQGKAYLQSAFTASQAGDLQRQAVLVHAMAVCQCGDFAYANRLFRERNRLGPGGLIYLALALAEMNHPEMARELFPLIDLPEDQKTFQASQRNAVAPSMRNLVELRALHLLALQTVDVRGAQTAKLADWLWAQRTGSRWPVEKANGPVVLALAQHHARATPQTETYTLDVAVNGRDVQRLSIDPRRQTSRQIAVPRDALNTEGEQRVELRLNGRATFTYSVVLSGFIEADKIHASTQDWTVARRYEPAPRLFAGRPVPRGFRIVDGSYSSFHNPLTELPVGNRADVTLMPRRRTSGPRTDRPYDYLVAIESIPAGCSVLEDSVRGSFERFEVEAGRIVFFIGTTQYPSNISYTLVGNVPGRYEVPQTILQSYYEPDRFALAGASNLTVLPAGQTSSDPYRQTPDELYHLGQQEFQRKNYKAAAEHLKTLLESWRLKDEPFKNVHRWMFAIALADQDHDQIVRFFEVLKEKYPDVEHSFEDILQVAQSYRQLSEFERSYLVYRATVQGSFERESQIAGFLDGRGQAIRSLQLLEQLLRDYPAESYIAQATYALAQETYRRAALASEDQRMKDAGITRVHLIQAAVQMLDHFITNWPEDPADDQASFALATALLDLQQYEHAIRRCETYAQRYPQSRLLDSFWYIIGYCYFELGQPEQALEMCRKVAEATFAVPESSRTRAADNRWEAIYIMGQIYHSLGQAEKAVTQYAKVRQRFVDAAQAIQFFERRSIEIDEVTTLRPDDPKQVSLRFRNLGEAHLKVYRIDLMKFGLMQRNLDRITAINLAGIKPHHEEAIDLGDGHDYRDRSIQMELPLEQQGAYLLVCRGDNLYASGLVLVSPLRLLVDEDATSGRVRVSVKDAVEDAFLSDVHVKVIGSENEDFVSEDTDLRGLAIADDIRGTSTVIAVHDGDQYAFYRGDTVLQRERLSEQADDAPADAEAVDEHFALPHSGSKREALQQNLFEQNSMFQQQQNRNLDSLLNNERKGIRSEEAY
ncbi:tetratricopeptide repeat protein [Roseimaritima sediminicola]|uniref:tetratricopeptide repeat protein n=1 Tax=Roseimaritima sediminicola TaxID=2662066 RepID=UPI0012983539|nr:tetratricopeptide repeat protein [Roseimaritima sediminicola]